MIKEKEYQEKNVKEPLTDEEVVLKVQEIFKKKDYLKLRAYLIALDKEIEKLYFCFDSNANQASHEYFVLINELALEYDLIDSCWEVTEFAINKYGIDLDFWSRFKNIDINLI